MDVLGGMAVLNQTIAIPIWGAVAAAALILVTVVLVGFESVRRSFFPLLGLAALLVAAVLSIFALDRFSATQALTQRQALDQRRVDLYRRASDSSSALLCLSGLPGAPVESACEKAVFASPQSIAEALSFAGAQLRLLSDIMAFTRDVDPHYVAAAAGLRRAAENDAFGLFSHVLTVRDGCTADKCAAFKLLDDATTIRSHMQQHVFAAHVARNFAEWSSAPVPTRDGSGRSTVSIASEPAGPSAKWPDPADPASNLESAAAILRGPATASTPLPLDRPSVASSSPTSSVVTSRFPTAAEMTSALAPAAMSEARESAPPAVAVVAPEHERTKTGELAPLSADKSTRTATASSVAAPLDGQPTRSPAARPHGIVPPADSVLKNLDFPSAASIPAIDIMRPEPQKPVPNVASAQRQGPAPSKSSQPKSDAKAPR